MPPLAVVILAHADARQVKRLTAALTDTPIVLHCDARTAGGVFQEMVTGLPSRVRVLDRIRTTVTSWSLVKAELLALREAVRWTGADHIAVLSGADYPIRPMAEIIQHLDRLEGRSWIHNVPLPLDQWNTPRHRDGGLWRLRYRYLTRQDQVLYWRKLPLRWPAQRPVPADITLRAASQWKIYSRTDAEALLHLADDRPDLIRFWSTTLVPDESFAASMLGSPRLRGSDALPPCDASAWYLDWRGDRPGHPRWLTTEDFDALAAARQAALDPEPEGRKLFARKFRSSDAAVLDRIDEELRR